MPRNVRNFWLVLEVDGKQERVATGPRNKEGGFQLTVLVREAGNVSDKKVRLTGREVNGKLVLALDGPGGYEKLLEVER